ncbi:unnamed protein product [Heligmosomoides polygyrus]|uniref:COesterase domain-containing protein n=1 Tax=Heligmosomoides polygyrus TaxID=6339 RepID=A0A183FMH1_HELPZ|nr:unnamed protein product [Heligmosomoides polygyrus]
MAHCQRSVVNGLEVEPFDIDERWPEPEARSLTQIRGDLPYTRAHTAFDAAVLQLPDLTSPSFHGTVLFLHARDICGQ